MQKLLTFFFSKSISMYAIFNDQSFNDTLTNDIVSFEQLGPECHVGPVYLYSLIQLLISLHILRSYGICIAKG